MVQKRDEWAIVLEFLPHGGGGEGRPEPSAQVVGEKYFSLLEVVPREDADLGIGDRIYIGDGDREKVKYIKRMLSVDDLTAGARAELEEVVNDIVREGEERFVQFFNDAEPISKKMHSLELLHGIGKKHMWEIIDERKVEDFESYEDIKERCPDIPDPQEMVKKRIMKELRGEDPRHCIFVHSKDEKRR